MAIGSSSAVLTISSAAIERLREVLASANTGEGLRVAVEKAAAQACRIKWL